MKSQELKEELKRRKKGQKNIIIMMVLVTVIGYTISELNSKTEQQKEAQKIIILAGIPMWIIGGAGLWYLIRKTNGQLIEQIQAEEEKESIQSR
jgi:hypothetical protein